MTMGERIAWRRDAKGLTQTQLATRMSSTQGTISKWENNEAMPELGNVVELCRHLYVTADWLIFGRGAVEPTDPGELERRLALVRRVLDSPPAEWERLWPED